MIPNIDGGLYRSSGVPILVITQWFQGPWIFVIFTLGVFVLLIQHDLGSKDLSSLGPSKAFKNQALTLMYSRAWT